ncbi:MAG: Hpt domain-containing protein [Magnetococcus sp. DMHC-8]
MARCLADRDGPGLEQAAHALKGVAATIGALKLAELAGRVETRARQPGGWSELPAWLDTLTTLLARMVAAIDNLPGTPALPVLADPQRNDTTPVELAPLFQQAVRLLHQFDSAAEGVIREIAARVGSAARRERVCAIQDALSVYDFEQCLAMLVDWAAAEEITLEVE